MVNQHSTIATANSIHFSHLIPQMRALFPPLCMAASKPTMKLAINIEPIGDRVVVMPIEKETTTKSGLIIPDTASGEKPQEGVVIALGTGGIGKDSIDPREFLKVGEHVLFGRYAGDDLKVKDSNGKDVELKVLHLDSVLGKMKTA